MSEQRWRQIAIDALLELQWWRQEYGDRPVSHDAIRQLLEVSQSAPAPGTGLPAPDPLIRKRITSTWS